MATFRLVSLSLAGAALLGCGRAKPLVTDAGAPPDPADAAPDVMVPPIALAVVNNGEILFLKGDGSSRTVYRFPAFGGDDGGVGFRHENVVAFGDGVVATVTTWLLGDPSCKVEMGLRTCPEVNLVVALDLDGRVRWEKRLSARTSSASFGVVARPGAGGWTVVTLGAGGMLVAPDGAESTLPVEARDGRPFPGPAVPARLPAGDAGRNSALFAWWRPGAPPAATDPPLVIHDEVAPFDDGNGINFVAVDDSGAGQIVHARPDRTELLPGKLAFPGPVSLASVGSWRAVGDATTLLRFDLLTGETNRVTPRLPDGLRALGGTTVGHDGALLGVLRGDYFASAYASADGSTWKTFGRSLGQVEAATIADVGGSYLVVAEGTERRFVPTQTWADPPPGQTPELLQSSIQLVRPATDLAAVIDLAWHPVLLSRDGTRAAYWAVGAAAHRQLVLRDLVRDVLTPVLESSAGLPPAFTLIEQAAATGP